jgi:chloramphenicol 3-O-phosphotransferase
MSAAHPRLIFLYGPPAVGKSTVARAIAEQEDVRVLHNHVTFDAVAEVFAPGTPTFWAALDKIRLDLATAAAGEGIDLVYTFVFAPGDEAHVDDVVRAYESAGGTAVLVQLVAPPDELRRRVTGASRTAHGKIRDAASLDGVLREHDVYAPIPGRDSLTIDTAAMSPEEAAGRILEHIEALTAGDDEHGEAARPP